MQECENVRHEGHGCWRPTARREFVCGCGLISAGQASLRNLWSIGSYLQMRVNHLTGPITAFRECIFRDVLPAFSNIDERARQVADEYFHRIGSQPAGDYELDMSNIAEAVQDHSFDWWQMMNSLQQTMLNLLAAGLFHLLEQQLSALALDASFSERPLKETKLAAVRVWYVNVLHLDVAALPSWNVIDELRIVANAVKHAEGSGTAQVRKLRPELFKNPL